MNRPSAALPSGAWLGVLGGGQLGRMFVHAAQALGFRVAALDPDPDAPALRAADEAHVARYDDAAALQRLAARCAAVTTEFENAPAASLRGLAAAGCPTAPAADAVEVCQHRLREKAHFVAAGVPCAPHAPISSPADLAASGVTALLPGILKTAELGYDGKGQRRVADPASLARAWDELGARPCVLESLLDIGDEISVIVARGRDGGSVHLPVQQNLHRDGILAVAQVPAPDIEPAIADAAVGCAQRLAQAMDYVGVLCVEFFVLRDGRLLANEMAPRPHNSGHYSIDACDVSQFELQARALAGWPLPQPRQHSPAVMLNLLGDLWLAGAGPATDPDWPAVLALPGVHLHLYGKAEPRHGRKMGHLTVTAALPAQAVAVARRAAGALRLPTDF